MATFTDPAERIERLLAQADSRLRRAFLDIVQAAKGRVDLSEVESLIRAGRVEAAISAIAQGMGEELAAATSQTFVLSAQSAQTFFTGPVSVQVVFDITNERAVQFLRNEKLRLITQISQSQSTAIRNALVDGTERGLNPRAQARLFRDTIGLTARQEQAVRNFRQMVVNRDRESLNRRLRDRRFDGALERAFESNAPIPDELIDRVTQRYRERMVKYRAEVIARTEALRAVHTGNNEMLQQAIEQGKIAAGGVQREWVTTRDGRQRDHHDSMHGQKVGLNEPFTSGLGNSLRFPGDPLAPGEDTIQCRCAVTTRITTL